eukprot:Skav223879  [mRNA]  locus=scaffold1226:486160:488450:+ [translate_table: standard]
MAAYFVGVSGAWMAVDMTVDEAQAWCVALLAAFVPPRLQRQFGLKSGKGFLPYCYNSIKPKCFANGRQRTCQKSGHSCMRRIVSYVKWPARRLWRQAGRAISFLLQTILLTDEVWSLKSARSEVERNMVRLLPARQVGRCDRCHGRCADIQAITADAGQFFECVSAGKACAALDEVIRLAKLDGHPASWTAKRSSERAQATEDKLMAEIQKLRKTLTPQGEPVTPAKQPATQPLSDFTPKGQSHLKTLLSFMSEGEVTPLVDLAKVRTWQDVEEQLHGRNLPLLKQFLATRLPDREVPSRKSAAVQKVLQLAKDALPR